MIQERIGGTLEVILLQLRPLSVGCCVIQKHRVDSNKRLIVIVEINGRWLISELHDTLAGRIQSLAKHAAPLHNTYLYSAWSKTAACMSEYGGIMGGYAAWWTGRVIITNCNIIR